MDLAQLDDPFDKIKPYAEKCSQHEDEVICKIAAELVRSAKIDTDAVGLRCGGKKELDE